MILVLDNFDSFTYNLVDYFQQLGVVCKVVRNNVPVADYDSLPFTGIVLSPGTGVPGTSGTLMEVIRQYHHKLPMLGICLGHQAIGQYFGASLGNAEKPMHGKVSNIYCKPSPIFDGVPNSIEVVRYNSLVLANMPNILNVTASAVNGEVMAFEHNSLPIFGLQFHPEAVLTQKGLKILKNWCLYNNIN